MSTETYHEMYRRTTLGNTLQESLDEMLTHNLITSGCAMKIMQKFDQCICTALSKRVKNRLFLKGHLNTYRNCDNVWTLVMNDVEIRDASVLLHVDKIKIVACECKDAKSARTAAALKGNPALSSQNSGTLTAQNRESEGLGGPPNLMSLGDDKAYLSDDEGRV
uniref:Transcription initiation factor IIA subunit 2 n=1 Tax=Schistocephalus solidus TaxID=70667 RepID=A0A0X3P3S4_SCHSO